ncbi:MAG TPA: acyl carrier protein [Thermoanaerobaculia bacterium]|jgi:acyl carrier protein
MDAVEIRAKIKEIIANVASLDPRDIGDTASFVDDLQLDSLSLLEIGVDVDYEFKLGVPEERLQELRTVQDTVELVVNTLAAKAGRAQVA